MSNFNDDISDLRQRVQKLEAASKPKTGWERFGNFLKMVVVPFTVMGAMFTLYDQFYLGWKESQQAEAVTAQSKLRALEDINTEIYSLNAPGSAERVGVILEAKAGRRLRLISEAYDFWKSRGDELNRYEKQMLANELYSIERVDSALEIIQDLQDEYVSPLDKVQIALFEGRVLGGGNPPKSIEGARSAFKRAFKNTEILRAEQKEELWAQISYAALFVEMYQKSDCKHAQLPAGILRDLVERDESPVNLGVLSESANQLLQVYATRCGNE
jgi:hypothetical protein